MKSARSIAVGVAIVATGMWGSACKRGAPGAPAAAPVQASQRQAPLPPGCATVASIQPAALGAVFGALRSRLAPDLLSSSALPLDLERDVRRLSFCGMPAPARQRGPYVAVFSGPLPANVLEVLASQSSGAPVSKDQARKISLLGRDGRWLALRERSPNDRELVVATTRALLDGALDGPTEYPLDLDAPASIIVDQRVFADRVPAGSGLEGVKAVRVKLLPGATAVDLRLSIGDEAQAQRLVPPIRSLMMEVARQLGNGDLAAAPLSTGVDAGDVIVRLGLPSEALAMLASRITSAPTQ